MKATLTEMRAIEEKARLIDQEYEAKILASKEEVERRLERAIQKLRDNHSNEVEERTKAYEEEYQASLQALEAEQAKGYQESQAALEQHQGTIVDKIIERVVSYYGD